MQGVIAGPNAVGRGVHRPSMMAPRRVVPVGVRPRQAASRRHQALPGSGSVSVPHHYGAGKEIKAEPTDFLQRKAAAERAAAEQPLQRTRTVLMAGNWKMNPASLKEAKELAALVASAARTTAKDKPGFNVEIAVIPPYPFIPAAVDALAGTIVKVGAQDLYPQAKGAFTGAVSPGMLSSLGVTYVLAGHSERRVIFKESDDEINKKVKAILAGGMSAILCIGESKQEYEAGLARTVCSTQLRGGLKDVSPEDMARVVIAYEPVWAIGTGLTATPAIAQSVHASIRAELADMYGPAIADSVRIQYGGSVTPETVDDLMVCPDIDGCLIGGASLAADKFARIFTYRPKSGPRRLFASEVLPADNNLGESPIWSVRDQRMYWVDAVGQSLWSWDLVNQPISYEFPEVVGCVALQDDGDLLLGLAEGIFTFSTVSETARMLCDFEPGLNTRPNDGKVDRAGNFVVGSYNNAHRQNGQEIGGLWRFSADGELREILDYKFRCSNAICFSPDGRTMYFTDTPTRRIFAFDYSPTGRATNRRMLYEMPSHLAGGPDGAQVDAQGYVWVALSGAGQVVRLSPVSGEVDMIVEVPCSSPTCVTIGGPNLDTLYVTTRKPDGGGLYAVQLPDGIKGLPEPEFRTGRAVSPSSSSAAAGSPRGSWASGSGSGSFWDARGSMSIAADSTWAGGSRASAALNGSGSHASSRSAFCDQCGAEYRSATSKFCSECGAPRA